MTRKQIHLFVLTLVLLLMLGGYIVMITVFKYQKDEQVMTALIALVSSMAIPFWFGTSASGQKKDELIATMAPTENTPPPSP